MEFDLNMIAGSEFEGAAQVAEWTMLGVGTIAASGADFYSGSECGLLTPGGGATEGIAYQDVVVRPGEELNFFGAAKGGTGDAHVRIRNRQTGKWLDGADGSWDASVIDVFDETASASWETKALTFTVESLEICKEDTVTLRVYLRASGSGTAKFDQIELWPSVNWASIHGHNIPPFITPTLQRSDDGSSWTTESTITLMRDSFYVALSTLESHRYWRILFDGQPDTGTLMYVGEIVLGQYFELLHNPQYGGGISWNDRQTRNESDIGDEFIQLHGRVPQRALSFTFGFKTDQEYEQFRDLIFRRSRGGVYPIVIAPYDLDPDVVIMGRIRETTTVVKSSFYPRSGEVEIIEAPLPNTPEIVHAYDAPIEGGG